MLFIFIKKLLAYELAHIHQYDSGKLTDEIVYKNKDTKYEEHWYEKEAKYYARRR
ncbi:hypothetical protein ACEI87_10185 [Clostridioides difficile]